MADIPKNRLATLRARSRLTQVEVSRIINKDPITISCHENHTRRVVEADIIAYAKLYKCETYEIFTEPQVADDASGGS